MFIVSLWDLFHVKRICKGSVYIKVSVSWELQLKSLWTLYSFYYIVDDIYSCVKWFAKQIIGVRTHIIIVLALRAKVNRGEWMPIEKVRYLTMGGKLVSKWKQNSSIDSPFLFMSWDFFQTFFIEVWRHNGVSWLGQVCVRYSELCTLQHWLVWGHSLLLLHLRSIIKFVQMNLFSVRYNGNKKRSGDYQKINTPDVVKLGVGLNVIKTVDLVSSKFCLASTSVQKGRQHLTSWRRTGSWRYCRKTASFVVPSSLVLPRQNMSETSWRWVIS